MVKGVRRCRARRARRIRGFNPHRRQNKRQVSLVQTERNIVIHRRKLKFYIPIIDVFGYCKGGTS